MDFSNVKQLIIPEGEVKQIAIGGAIVWKKPLYDAQVEYLESDGAQWIDTGISCAAATFGFEGDFSVNSLATAQGIFGCRMQDGSAGNHSYNAFVHNGGMRCDTIGSSSWNYSITADTPIHYVYTPTATTVDGTSQNNLTKVDCSYTFYLFNFHVPSGAYSTGCAQKVYGWKIYVGDTLVRDYVPVRKNGVGYLFDRVSETLFGNQGSGNFALGPDIVPIEYIESTGTQYIDTGIVPIGSGTSVECVFSNSVNGNFSPVLWSRGSSSVDRAFCFEVEQNQQARWDYADYGPIQRSNVVPLNERVTLAIENGTATVNGEQLARVTKEFTGAGSIILFNFCNYINGERQMLSANNNPIKIYSCKIYIGGVLVSDFKPVRAGTTGYLLDKVSGRLFGNKGTGNFVCGGDI